MLWSGSVYGWREVEGWVWAATGGQVQDAITRGHAGHQFTRWEAGAPPGAWARQVQEECEKAAPGLELSAASQLPGSTSHSDPSGDKQTSSEGKAERVADLGELVREETNEGEGREGKEGEEWRDCG